MRALILWLLLAASLPAHLVDQLFAEVQSGGRGVEVLFDVGYAKAEWRDDPDTPQPTREWLAGLPEETWEELREDSRSYLEECLDFKGPDGPVAMDWSFPDFESSPPGFPKLLTGGAYMRVLIVPAGPVNGLSCLVAPGERPDFTLQIPTTGLTRYVTLAPGDSWVLIEATERARPEAEEAPRQESSPAVPQGRGQVLGVIGLFLAAGVVVWWLGGRVRA